MKWTALLALFCTTAFCAETVVVKPRVVIVVRPRYEAANVVGGVIGNAIAQWMFSRQNRGARVCDSLFDSNCNITAPVAVEPSTGPGTSYLPGQCPGLAPCAPVR